MKKPIKSKYIGSSYLTEVLQKLEIKIPNPDRLFWSISQTINQRINELTDRSILKSKLPFERNRSVTAGDDDPAEKRFYSNGDYDVLCGLE